ncbi:UNVERIFIED_CONTAM: hypothetical protein K2H54_031595 [Gekko kuhli]
MEGGQRLGCTAHVSNSFSRTMVIMKKKHEEDSQALKNEASRMKGMNLVLENHGRNFEQRGEMTWHLVEKVEGTCPVFQFHERTPAMELELLLPHRDPDRSKEIPLLTEPASPYFRHLRQVAFPLVKIIFFSWLIWEAGWQGKVEGIRTLPCLLFGIKNHNPSSHFLGYPSTCHKYFQFQPDKAIGK